MYVPARKSLCNQRKQARFLTEFPPSEYHLPTDRSSATVVWCVVAVWCLVVVWCVVAVHGRVIHSMYSLVHVYVPTVAAPADVVDVVAMVTAVAIVDVDIVAANDVVVVVVVVG